MICNENNNQIIHCVNKFFNQVDGMEAASTGLEVCECAVRLATPRLPPWDRTRKRWPRHSQNRQQRPDNVCIFNSRCIFCLVTGPDLKNPGDKLMGIIISNFQAVLRWSELLTTVRIRRI
jgi:hypothetical protein